MIIWENFNIRLATSRKSVGKFWFCKLALTLRVRLARALCLFLAKILLSNVNFPFLRVCNYGMFGVLLGRESLFEWSTECMCNLAYDIG